MYLLHHGAFSYQDKQPERGSEIDCFAVLTALSSLPFFLEKKGGGEKEQIKNRKAE